MNSSTRARDCRSSPCWPPPTGSTSRSSATRLGLSDSALSKQFATLETAGYIAIERPMADRRRRVHVRLTDTGRRAFEGHVAALRQIVASVDETATR